jgi:tetratricopeptide (TPR) repeat protein
MEHAHAALALRSCGRDDLAWEHERLLLGDARVALPQPWMDRFIETAIRLQKTVETVPALSAHEKASTLFWHELIVDAVAHLGTTSEGQAVEAIGRALRTLATKEHADKDLTAALEVLANYPPHVSLDEHLISWAAPPFDREQRLALWRLLARRAPPTTPASGERTFEEAVRRSGSPEAWIALAELWRTEGQPLSRVESAWRRVRWASPERLAFWDSIGDERRAAEESEALAREDTATDRRSEALRRWIKLGDLDRARAFWDRVLRQSPRDRAALLWLVQAAPRLRDPRRLAQASASLLRLNARDDDAREIVGEAWLAMGTPTKAIAIWQTLRPASASRLAEVLLAHDLPEDALAVIARAKAVGRDAPIAHRLTALALERERRRDEAFGAWWALYEDPRADDGQHDEAARHLLELIPTTRRGSAEEAALRLEDRVPRAPTPTDVSLLVRLARHLGRGDEVRVVLQRGVTTWLDTRRGAPGAAERSALASFAAAFRELRAEQEEETLWRRVNDQSRPACLWCRWQKALAALRRAGFAEAEDDLQVAMRMEPDAELAPRLAELAERLGRADLAQHFYERALALRPDDDASRFALSRWQLRQGDRIGALAALRVDVSRTSAEPRAELPDLARQDLDEARRDQAVWEGVTSSPPPMTAADVVDRLYELNRQRPTGSRESTGDQHSLEALHLAGLRARERRLPFRWTPTLVAHAEGPLGCGLVWYAANARDASSLPFLKDVVRTSADLGPLAVLALARVAPHEAVALSLALLRDPRQPEPMGAAAALALAATPNEPLAQSAIDALRETVLRRDGLAARAAARALGARGADVRPATAETDATRDALTPTRATQPRQRPLPQSLPWVCESPAPAESLLEVLTETGPCSGESACR